MTAQAQPKISADAQGNGPYVINLCSSSTPMALAQPKNAELKRFSFFVSRRRADGRDRFHLHMGYFTSLAEAEEWVNAVRDIYPGAWAGETPGKKLAARAAAAAAATPAAPSAPAVVVVSAPAAAPIEVPTLHAPVETAQAQRLAAAATAATSQPSSPPPRAAVAAPSAPAASAKSTPVAARAKPQSGATSPSAPAAPAAAPTVKKSLPPASNVREVLKALDDTGPTRTMQAPSAAAPALSDTAVLRILENRSTEPRPRTAEPAARGIELLRPDDTSTVRALKEAVRDNQPVSFAVQLQWSVQPIDLTAVPPLAIFSAYTLYTVEGSRDGRKWYGLRLGFFGDAISAKQVASYVRSEFTSVAVVPVSTQERGRASDGSPKALDSTARMRKDGARKDDEFKLIEDGAREAISPGLLDAQAKLKATTPPAKNAPGKLAKRKALGRVSASEKRAPKSLEETLEILGAGNLEIDNGRGELLNDSGVRHLRIEVQQQKNSPFARLLDRLTERVKKN